MFFGWYVVGGSLVAQMFVLGFFTYSVSLILPFVREEFGVTMEQVMYSLTAGTFAGMILLPIAGIILDRYSIRWLMAAGTALFAGGIWMLGNSASIAQFVIIFGLTMAIANSFAGAVASQTVVSRWFTTSRGRALGISSIGTSLGGIAIPALIAWWLHTGGWRLALENLALSVALLVLPIVILTIRGTPAEMGLLPENGNTPVSGDLPDPELGLRDILRDPAYWIVGISIGLLFAVYASMLASLAPYATGLGATSTQASTLIMVVAVMGLLGKLLFGFAADKINLKLGLWLAMGLVLVAFLIMASEPGYTLVLLAAGLLGLATGGMLPVWGAIMAKVFGLVSYGRAMGLMGPLITLLVMPSFAIVGRLYDATGSYRLCLLLYAGIIGLSIGILIPLKLVMVNSRNKIVVSS